MYWYCKHNMLIYIVILWQTNAKGLKTEIEKTREKQRDAAPQLIISRPCRVSRSISTATYDGVNRWKSLWSLPDQTISVIYYIWMRSILHFHFVRRRPTKFLVYGGESRRQCVIGFDKWTFTCNIVRSYYDYYYYCAICHRRNKWRAEMTARWKIK